MPVRTDVLARSLLQRHPGRQAYLVRAFLMFNASFEIRFWLNYLVSLKLPEVRALLPFLPLCDVGQTVQR